MTISKTKRWSRSTLPGACSKTGNTRGFPRNGAPRLRRTGKELIVESRCEQLTEEKLSWATSINNTFTVAIGLEAYDDEVLRFHVNKGFSTSSWDRAVANLQKFNLRIKTYLMFKPPS